MSKHWIYIGTLWILLAVWNVYDHDLNVATYQGLLGLMSIVLYSERKNNE